MVDPALVQLARLVEAAETDAVKLSAIKDVLDRAGYSARQRIDVTSNGQSLIKSIPADDLALINGPG
jgi:hypothetical protein